MIYRLIPPFRRNYEPEPDQSEPESMPMYWVPQPPRNEPEAITRVLAQLEPLHT